MGGNVHYLSPGGEVSLPRFVSRRERNLLLRCVSVVGSAHSRRQSATVNEVPRWSRRFR